MSKKNITTNEPVDLEQAALDAANTELPADKLERLIALTQRAEAQKKFMDDAAQKAKDAKAAYTATEQVALPELLQELSLKEITLDSGVVITLVADAKASITEANHVAAMKWLKDNKFGGLIKTKIEVDFEAGAEDDIKAAIELLAENGMKPILKQGVHAATLKSFAKERLEQAKPIPMKTFGVFSFNKAVIKVKK